MNLPVSRAAKLLVAFCVLLAMATVGNAAPPKLKPKPKIAYMAISSVDTKAMTITIEPKNSTATGTKTYKFTPQTKVTVNGHDGKIDDLTAGLQIRVGTGSDETVADELTASNPPPDPDAKK